MNFLRLQKTLVELISKRLLNVLESLTTRVWSRRTDPCIRYVSQYSSDISGFGSPDMEDLTPVLLDHILYVSCKRPPAIVTVDAILPDFVSSTGRALFGVRSN